MAVGNPQGFTLAEVEKLLPVPEAQRDLLLLLAEPQHQRGMPLRPSTVLLLLIHQLLVQQRLILPHQAAQFFVNVPLLTELRSRDSELLRHPDLEAWHPRPLMIGLHEDRYLFLLCGAESDQRVLDLKEQRWTEMPGPDKIVKTVTFNLMPMWGDLRRQLTAGGPE